MVIVIFWLLCLSLLALATALALLTGVRRTTDRAERLFLAVASLPLVIGVLIPSFINLVSAQPETNRDLLIFITRISLLLSALLSVMGGYITWRRIHERASVNTILLIIGLFIAALPLVVWSIYFLVFRIF